MRGIEMASRSGFKAAGELNLVVILVLFRTLSTRKDRSGKAYSVYTRSFRICPGVADSTACILPVVEYLMFVWVICEVFLTKYGSLASGLTVLTTSYLLKKFPASVGEVPVVWMFLMFTGRFAKIPLV